MEIISYLKPSKNKIVMSLMSITHSAYMTQKK